MEMLVTFALKSVLIAGVTLGLLHLLRGRSAAERSMVAHLGLLASGAVSARRDVPAAAGGERPLLEAAPVEPAQLPVGPITDTPALPAAEAFQQRRRRSPGGPCSTASPWRCCWP
jgi:bla regulator protein BlaR1